MAVKRWFVLGLLMVVVVVTVTAHHRSLELSGASGGLLDGI